MENPMDRGAWWASVHTDAKSQTQLSIHVSIKLSQVVLVLKNLPANAGDRRDVSWTPGSGRSPGVRNSNMLQYSCLENSMDRGAWQAMVHGVKESDATEHTHTSTNKHKAIITKTVLWWWGDICRSMDQNRESEIDSHKYVQLTSFGHTTWQVES